MFPKTISTAPCPTALHFLLELLSLRCKRINLASIRPNKTSEHDLYFLDSRTILTNATEDACKETNSIYLGRDVFLEVYKTKEGKGTTFFIKLPVTEK